MARSLTPGGKGVDHILELGGQGTVAQSIRAIKRDGVISTIGLLGGEMPDTPLMETLGRIFIARGVYVGSRTLFEGLAKAVEEHDIHPVIDQRQFTLEQAREAYDYMVR